MTNDSKNASFAYSLNMLRLLLGMRLITDEEYRRIAVIAEEHYRTGFYCV